MSRSAGPAQTPRLPARRSPPRRQTLRQRTRACWWRPSPPRAPFAATGAWRAPSSFAGPAPTARRRSRSKTEGKGCQGERWGGAEEIRSQGGRASITKISNRARHPAPIPTTTMYCASADQAMHRLTPGVGNVAVFLPLRVSQNRTEVSDRRPVEASLSACSGCHSRRATGSW